MQQQQQQKGGGGATAGACKTEEGVSDQFPAGLRVLVVDDDTACRRILEQQLRKCHYQVTTCRHARIALSLLRERKGGFDLVISDVHMPDMDGFKLLEHVGLEMDLPVIMMSADERTSAVMRGIKHGACDYLIKPVRMEELKNIWQHVIRKKWNGSKDNEHSGSLEDSDRQRRGGEEEEYASSVNDGTDSNWKVQKKKRESKEEEEEGDTENDDTAAAKKPRVVWSVELHQQFVSAVNQLGIDKAVPKRILELMNVPGLTRENVASHLQKFRLYLKRLSGVTQQQGGISNPYCGPVESNSKANAIGRLDFQAAVASVNIPSHAMTALHAELLGRPPGTVILPEMEQHPLVRSSARYLPAERGIAFGQPVKCQSGAQKLFPQTNMVLGDMTSGFATWSPNLLASSCPINNRSTTINLSGGNMLAQQVPPQQQSQSILSESTHAHSVRQEAQTVPLQSACLIAPSRSSDSFSSLNNVDPCNTGSIPISSLPSVAFQGGGASVPIMQTSNLNEGIPTVNYSLISSQLSSLPQDIGKLQDGEYKSMSMLNEFSVPAPAPSVSSALTSDEGNSSWKLRNSSVNFMSPSNSLAGSVDSGDILSSVAHRGIFPDQGQVKNLGYVGRAMSIPSRFAIDDLDSHGGDNLMRKEMGYGDDGARGVQEIRLDFVEGSKLETSTMAHSSSSDLMSILSK